MPVIPALAWWKQKWSLFEKVWNIACSENSHSEVFTEKKVVASQARCASPHFFGRNRKCFKLGWLAEAVRRRRWKRGQLRRVKLHQRKTLICSCSCRHRWFSLRGSRKGTESFKRPTATIASNTLSFFFIRRQRSGGGTKWHLIWCLPVGSLLLSLWNPRAGAKQSPLIGRFDIQKAGASKTMFLLWSRGATTPGVGGVIIKIYTFTVSITRLLL